MIKMSDVARSFYKPYTWLYTMATPKLSWFESF